MVSKVNEISIQKTARTAGLLYLILAICGGFAEFAVRQGMVVAGNACGNIQQYRRFRIDLPPGSCERADRPGGLYPAGSEFIPDAQISKSKPGGADGGICGCRRHHNLPQHAQSGGRLAVDQRFGLSVCF